MILEGKTNFRGKEIFAEFFDLWGGKIPKIDRKKCFLLQIHIWEQKCIFTGKKK